MSLEQIGRFGAAGLSARPSVGLIQLDEVARGVEYERLVSEALRVFLVVDSDAALSNRRNTRREVFHLNREMRRLHGRIGRREEMQLRIGQLEPRTRGDRVRSIWSVDRCKAEHVPVEAERGVGIAHGYSNVMESSWRFSHPPILPGLGRPRHGTPASLNVP